MIGLKLWTWFFSTLSGSKTLDCVLSCWEAGVSFCFASRWPLCDPWASATIYIYIYGIYSVYKCMWLNTLHKWIIVNPQTVSLLFSYRLDRANLFPIHHPFSSFWIKSWLLYGQWKPCSYWTIPRFRHKSSLSESGVVILVILLQSARYLRISWSAKSS